MSLHKRLERLEVLSGGKAEPQKIPRALERLLHIHEQARKELYDLEPLPDLPYTDEDLEDDRDTLENLIPAYRESPGYQSGEGKAFLDHWEQDLRERIAKGVDE